MIDPDMEALAKSYRSIKMICRKCYARLPENCINCRKCRSADIRKKHQIKK
jgi:ribosomal protein L40E